MFGAKRTSHDSSKAKTGKERRFSSNRVVVMAEYLKKFLCQAIDKNVSCVILLQGNIPLMSVTLAKIAQIADIHPSTVSLVLNSGRHDRVSVETRVKIERIASELGYRVNRRAQGLVRGSTRSIALLLNHLSNPFFGKYVSVIESETKGSGYHVMPFETRGDSKTELELLSLHRQGLCDLVLSLCHYKTDYDESLAGQPIVVRIGGWDPTASRNCPVPHIVVDYRPAWDRVLTSLVQTGRKHLGLVVHEPNPVYCEKSEPSAYSKTMRSLIKKSGLRSGIDSQVLARESDPLEVWHDRALKLLQEQPQIDCLLVHTTEYIAPVIEAAYKAGRTIGKDLAMAASDDPPFAAWIAGGITTVHEPIEQVAKALAQQALAVLQDRTPPPPCTIEAELVERHSTRPELRAGVVQRHSK
jgi:LacI family transcriptional regulator